MLFHFTLKQKGKLHFFSINHKELQLEGRPVPFNFCGHIYILKLNFPLLVFFPLLILAILRDEEMPEGHQIVMTDEGH